jgi:WD40 repeat protein
MADGPDSRAETLFAELADLPPHEQQARLDAACRDDATLRAAVEKLLADDARLGAEGSDITFLNSPLVRADRPTMPPADGGPPSPPRLARYRLLRLLGQGGMGAVYEAEQDTPRRLVALKVIRSGYVSTNLLKRFAREAEILGRLHHPGIAQIYEAGVAEDGRPFFALELIRGVALDEHARLRSLTLAARLDLVARVCDAVQHAHDQGIIHRDLKPGNILVDEAGQPKVLDFGVARASDADLLTSADRTRTGQLVGTLSYMSPEQVSADPAALDARSDVYALGVILFELLSGRLPYLLGNLPLPEAARVIREREPSRLGSIDTSFRGDLETIVAKALEKDPARRYQSVAELAADLRRHLRHEPIRARPPSALYQLAKFARRNKALVGGTAAVVLALAAGLLGTTLFAVREAKQRGQAERNERAAVYQAYRARIAAAAAALQNHDVADAARHLDQADVSLRDWEWRHLHSRLDDSLADFPTPVGATYVVSGEDGLRLAVLEDDGLRLLDEEGRTERLLPSPRRGGNVVWTIVPARDGLHFLERVPGGVILRDEAGREQLRLELPAGVESAQWTVSPDLKWLAVGWGRGAEPVIVVYDSTGKERCRLPSFQTEALWSITFSPDGRRLATASDDGTARLWEVPAGRPIGGPLRHPGGIKVMCAAFRPDGARFLTTSADGTVCQWDAATAAPVEPPYERHSGEVWTATYSPDGRWVASSGTDRTVRLWRATGRQDALVLHGHTDSVPQLGFSADGRRLLSVSQDGTARLWDADPEVALPVLRGHESYVYPVAYSPDGRWIASGSWDGTVRLWDAVTGEPGAVMELGNNVRTLAFGPDGTWIVTGCDKDERVQVWDVATARRRATFPGPGGDLGSVAVSPDGSRVAALSHQGRLHVYEYPSGKEVFRLDQGKEAMRGIAYSPDGRWLACTEEDLKTICLLDARTYRPAARLAGHTKPVAAVAFSPDGRRLVSAGEDRVVRVWDVDSRECRAELRGHTDGVLGAAFHPGGTRLATGGRDRTIWLWDLTTGEEVARLQGHTSYVWGLAFSPDGKTLVSGSGDKTVRLWDTEPLRVRHRARGAAARRVDG